MRQPLARQILLPMVGILLLTVGLASALNAWLASEQVRRRIQSQLADVAQTLAASNFPLESGVLRQTRGLTGAEYVLVDSTGQRLAASNAALAPLTVRPPADEGRLDQAHRVSSAGAVYFHTTLTIDRRPVGGTRQALHVFYPEQAWREARWQAAWPPLAIGGAASVLIAAAALLIAARVTQPIRQLRSQVERIAHGDFSPVPEPTQNDEVRDLAIAVNQMAERLAQYEQETRASERLQTLATLGGGIAHQIRNAATGCRMAIDLHERDCRSLESDNAQEPLTVAVRQLELIETHVRQFLTLGRPPTAERRQTELAAAIEQAIRLVQPMASHCGADIHFQRPPLRVVLMADPQALGQMLVNLLVNAVQAAAQAKVSAGLADQESSGVIVKLSRPAADRARIAVGDPGPGPAPAMQDRLFEPFATDKPGGTGLGLVVARQIAEDHGGQIRWQRGDDHTWFIIELPTPESCPLPPDS